MRYSDDDEEDVIDNESGDSSDSHDEFRREEASSSTMPRFFEAQFRKRKKVHVSRTPLFGHLWDNINVLNIEMSSFHW